MYEGWEVLWRVRIEADPHLLFIPNHTPHSNPRLEFDCVESYALAHLCERTPTPVAVMAVLSFSVYLLLVHRFVFEMRFDHSRPLVRICYRPPFIPRAPLTRILISISERILITRLAHPHAISL